MASDAPEGLCARCLLSAAVKAPTGAAMGSGTLPAASPEEIAEFFPHLEILELLGRGGMGVVYKARQRQLDRMIALKILPPEAGADPAFAERFGREARSLARLNHPNIVAVYDFGQTEGLFYLIMEFIDGANLREVMRSGGMRPEEALAIVPRICEALQYAHDEGIMHRDIKPENILIDKKGRVKIADFGLAKILGLEQADGHLTVTGMSLGTPRYMAPEQVEHPEQVDHRADIYSLGVVFYEMLTGELPIGRFAAPSERVKIDVRLDEIVLRSLEKDVERRYQHVSEVKTDVENVTGGVEKMPAFMRQMLGTEYKSERKLWGLPLVHIAFGIDPRTGKPRTARGVLAIGDRAYGVFAFGGFAMGAFAFGGVALGGISFGGVTGGLVSFGGVALALLLAFGGFAIGAIAYGGFAAGYLAMGGSAWGVHAAGGNARDPIAMRFLRDWWNPMWVLFWVVFVTSMVVSFGAQWWARRKGTSAPATEPETTVVSGRTETARRRWEVALYAVAALCAIVFLSWNTRQGEFDGLKTTLREAGAIDPWFVSLRVHGGYSTQGVNIATLSALAGITALLAVRALMRLHRERREIDGKTIHASTAVLSAPIVGAALLICATPWRLAPEYGRVREKVTVGVNGALVDRTFSFEAPRLHRMKLWLELESGNERRVFAATREAMRADSLACKLYLSNWESGNTPRIEWTIWDGRNAVLMDRWEHPGLKNLEVTHRRPQGSTGILPNQDVLLLAMRSTAGGADGEETTLRLRVRLEPGAPTANEVPKWTTGGE